MGQRGPAPLPSNVHLLGGNRSKKPLDLLADEFQPEVEIPDCPPWCWSEAKKEWKRITPELKRYGLISRLDRAALSLYCQAWAEYVWHKSMLSRAMKVADKGRKEAEAEGKAWSGGDGVMVPTANGNLIYSHHWVAARQAGREVSQFLAAFGLSPSSRTRVSPSDNRQPGLFDPENPEQGGDEWDRKF